MDKYDEAAASVLCGDANCESPSCLADCGKIAAFGRECAAQAFEEAAKEALKGQAMILSKDNVRDGMLDDNHPVIVARRVMREDIAGRLMAKAAALRPVAAKQEGGGCK